MSIQAYIDDSRSDTGDQRLVLAGFINTAEKWARFSDAWYAELRRAPSIEYFKMVEAAGLRGEFGGWTMEDRDNKVADLARIIRHWEPATVHSSVSQRQVREIIHPVAPYGLRDAYAYAFEALLIPTAIHQVQHRKDLMQVPIDFVFDNQEGMGQRAKELYQAIRLNQPKAVQNVLAAEPAFRDDKAVMPLQAADMLAWHIRRHFENGDPNKFMVPDFLSADGMHMGMDLEEEHLRRFADGYAKVPGVEVLVEKARWNQHRREMKRLGLPTYVSPAAFRRSQRIQRLKMFFAKFIGR